MNGLDLIREQRSAIEESPFDGLGHRFEFVERKIGEAQRSENALLR
jgi:hypothetical protein